jgi:hypothetical protein
MTFPTNICHLRVAATWSTKRARKRSKSSLVRTVFGISL